MSSIPPSESSGKPRFEIPPAFRFTRADDPPVWSPAQMRRAALQVTLVVAMLGVGSFFLLTRSLRDHKIQQKLERSVRDLIAAQGLFQERTREGVPLFSPEPSGAMPEEFAKALAEKFGSKPLHQEMGRVGRMDVFAGKPYAEPLFYDADGARWLVASRGPDGTFELEPGVLAKHRNTRELLAVLDAVAYDPTNGAQSGGDLWTSSEKP